MEQSLTFELWETNKVLQQLLLCSRFCRDGHCSVTCTSSSLAVFLLCLYSFFAAPEVTELHVLDFFAFCSVKEKTPKAPFKNPVSVPSFILASGLWFPTVPQERSVSATEAALRADSYWSVLVVHISVKCQKKQLEKDRNNEEPGQEFSVLDI